MKYLKKFFSLLLWFVFILIALLFVQYVFAPVYDFHEKENFSGDHIYNPYQHMDSSAWKKANFQVQSRVWGGITNGRDNSNSMIDSIYRYLDYDIIAISDYMRINKFGREKKSYLPVYEHGYSILKHHQICVGAERVNWRDYAFYQSLHHKQHIIDILRDENEFIIMAHPKLRDAFDPGDFSWLRGFDAIEILNFYRVSIAHWDSALSAGNFVTAIGNDDAHDISNPDEVGQYCTFINTEMHSDSIISALRQGNSYAARMFRYVGETYEEKKKKLDEVAQLSRAELVGDTFYVKVDLSASQIRFIGQGGHLLKETENASEAFYVIRDEDTYVRTELIFPNRNEIYLNPLVRYSQNWPPARDLPKVNPLRTWIYRILVGATFAFVIINIIILRQRLIKKKS